MESKTDSPKLSPAERLARKRAAARLRQQRCRARKRQVMLEKKRGEVRQQCVKITRDHSRPAVMHAIHHHSQTRFPTYKPLHSTESGESWVGVSGERPPRQHLHKFSSEPIYNCVSFESQKSSEEAQHNMSRGSSSPPRSPSEKSPIVVTPSRTPPPGKQTTLVRVLSDEKLEEPLVPEEEAAVAAMLSLKSGSKTPTEKYDDKCKQLPHSPPHSPPREVMISHESKFYTSSSGIGRVHSTQMHQNQNKHIHSVQSQQQRRMDPRYYNYGPPMQIQHPRRTQAPPGYYRVHAPVPPPHPHYSRGYYPPAPRFVSYEYE